MLKLDYYRICFLSLLLDSNLDSEFAKLAIERQSFVKAKGQPSKHMTAVNVRLNNKVTQQHRKHLGAVHTTPEKSESKALFPSVLCEGKL